jgi:flavin-dependent dehydrogenase
VRQLEFRADGVYLQSEQREYRAQVLIGADGATGITRRWMRHQEAKGRVARTIEFIQPTSPEMPLFRRRMARFDFSLLRQGLQGYAWDFPFVTHAQSALNRGIYDARLDQKKPSFSLATLMPTVFHPPQSTDSSPLQGHPIHRFSPRNRFSAPRLLLVGDAAGVDPLFGEGIGPALAYGKLAAQAILDAFARRDFSFSSYRSLLKQSALGRYLMARWFTAEVCYRMVGQGWFPQLVWGLGKLLARLFPEPEPLFSPER